MPKFKVLHAEQVGDVFNVTFQDPRNGEEYVTVAQGLNASLLRRAIQSFFTKRNAPTFIPASGPKNILDQEISVSEV